MSPSLQSVFQQNKDCDLLAAATGEEIATACRVFSSKTRIVTQIIDDTYLIDVHELAECFPAKQGL